MLINYIATLTISASASCPITIFTLADGQIKTARDVEVLEIAKEGCKRKFGEDSCLKKLHKSSERSYRATCEKAKKDE